MKPFIFFVTLILCTCTLSITAQTAGGCQASNAKAVVCKPSSVEAANTSTLTSTNVSTNPVCTPSDPQCQPCPPGCCSLLCSAAALAVKAVTSVAIPVAASVNSSNCTPVKCEPAGCKGTTKVSAEKTKAVSSL